METGLLENQLYTDDELMSLLFQGGKAAELAFTTIYDKYATRIRAYCYTVMKDSEIAGDIFQETFIKFFNATTKEEKKGTPIGWLITIARNLCLNAKRDAKPNIALDKIDLRHEGPMPYEAEENSKLVGVALDALENQMREAVALRYFEDMPYDSIAEILGITSARARYLVFTAKGKMKKKLQPYLKEL